MSERRGNWQQTYTGRQFWPCDPRPEDVVIEDIAHALSNLCRFAGHCREFYSVAEHSVWVARAVARYARECGSPAAWADQLSLAGLLHDAAEAYCVDVPRPLKPFLTGYREIEHGVAAVIAERFGFSVELFDHPFVKRADESLLMTEKRDLMAPPPAPWTFAQGVEAECVGNVSMPWGPREARAAFHSCFNRFYRHHPEASP